MRYADLIMNDVVNGSNISVSLFVQGCDRHCPGCFNSETWNFEGGHEIDVNELIQKIIIAINKNGIQRNFSILGGEPLNPQNRENVATIVKAVREIYPDIIIWIWTGYTFDELLKDEDENIRYLLSNITFLVDGPYVESERDLSLPYRGSRNQQIRMCSSLTQEQIQNNFTINDRGIL